MELTNAQIERQDFVDNAIFELLRELQPAAKDIDWDIEKIAEVRDSIAALFEQNGICTENDFYPYIEE